MSKYGSASVKIFVASSGGTSYDISQYCDELGGVKITALTEPSHSFGDSWEEHTPVGLARGEAFDIGGLFDDTATSGPHALLSAIDRGTTDATRAVVVGFSSGNYWHGTCRLTGYEVVGSNGKLSRFRASLLPTGSASWTATTT